MYCKCHGGPKSFGVAMLDDEPQWDYWVCSDCGMPSKMVFEKETHMRVPFDSQKLLSLAGQRDGTWTARWAMTDGSRLTTMIFTPYPRKVDMADNTESLLYELWVLLDSKVDIILRPVEGPGDNALEADARERAKYEARGVAEALALLMKPFYGGANAIVKEAVRRHECRAAGERPNTPGLAEDIWDPQMNWDGTPRVKVATAKARTAARPKATPTPKPGKGTEVDPNAVEGIKEAVKSGMFGIEEIASMFGVTKETVEKLTS